MTDSRSQAQSQDDALDALERDYRHWQKAIDEGRVLTGDYILDRLVPALLDAFPGLMRRIREAERPSYESTSFDDYWDDYLKSLSRRERFATWLLGWRMRFRYWRGTHKGNSAPQ